MRAITEADPTLSESLESRGYRVTINKSHKCERNITENLCGVYMAPQKGVIMINSRQKGARFERELVKKLREYGYDCRRGQQYCGANGDADVVGLPGVHIEAKAVERLNIHEAVKQARRDAREGEMPAVFHKKNNQGILVTVTFEDFMSLYKKGFGG